MTSTPVFETKVCTRCGGCGKYSWNARDQDRCYGCGGKGWTYTKRGGVASTYYNGLLTVTVGQLTVGQHIWYEGITWGGDLYHRWAKVLEINTDNIVIQDGKEKVTQQLGGGETFRRMVASEEEHQALIAKALEYQSNLTLQGKPRKIAKGESRD
jgi:DnaJ-class molecular chaperone